MEREYRGDYDEYREIGGRRAADLWEYLAAAGKPILLYGMGNGADKIIAALQSVSLTPAGVFASDEFVRGQSFHGMPVLHFEDCLARYGADGMIVLVAFASSLPAVMAQMEKVAATCETYVPDVPVRGNTLFTAAFAAAHRAETDEAEAYLADERSRAVFRGILRYRRFGELSDLTATADDREKTLDTLLHFSQYRLCVDAGAYDGDTARELMRRAPLLQKVYAWEPDRRNFRRLTERNTDGRLVPVPAAAWIRGETLFFDDAGNRNAGHDENGTARRRAEVCALRIDERHAGEPIDYIKYDVEGCEREAIEGSAGIIRASHPDLLVSAYHKTEDIYALILQLHGLCPAYRLYLRRFPYIPAWDLCLIATVK